LYKPSRSNSKLTTLGGLGVKMSVQLSYTLSVYPCTRTTHYLQMIDYVDHDNIWRQAPSFALSPRLFEGKGREIVEGTGIESVV
jgi:hypothetical protein